jgi:hypothetical protein
MASAARCERRWRASWLAALLALGAAAHGADVPIRSRAELDTHLREHGASSPLMALSPGARERFLHSLRFGEGGLASASGIDLADELTQEQIVAVLGLFGPEARAQAPPSLLEEVRGVEKNVRTRDEIGTIERRYNDYFKAVDGLEHPDSDARAAAKGAAFDEHLADLYGRKVLVKLDDRELRLLRRAAHEVAMATREARHVAAFHAVFDERRRRELLSTSDLETLQALLLSSHRIAEARRLALDHPSARLPRLPTFQDDLGKPSGPTVWRMVADGRRLIREAVDLEPTQILVTAGCHLAVAADDIEADPVLGPAFARHARWLSQAPGVEAIDDVRRWIAQRPASPMFMIFDRAEWPLLPSWRMPEFHVVREGRVIESMSGWQRDPGHRARLVAMLSRHGLLSVP